MTIGSRVLTIGRQPASAPKGTFREVHFPQLAKMEEMTNEGMISRILHADGGDSRSLPRTIYFQKVQEPGHFGSVAVGALHEVTVDGETNILSGKGWLVDSPEGREAATYIAAQALFHNSVDLADTKVRIEEEGDFWDEDFHVIIHFDEWNVGATTFVGKPAFADAHGVLPDEVMASLADDSTPLVVDCPAVYRLLVATNDEEVAARATGLPKWDYFHQPEATEPHPIKFGEPDSAGFVPVSGHLALWDSCLGDDELRCVRPPRPVDGYASFNKPGVLTDRGEVECGPIALYGGHISLDKAADDPANAWCDVRVVAGVHGPWISGVVRPGIDDVGAYVARASDISGHWKGGRLRMITSVNSPGFLVPGSGFSFSTDADGEVEELVASYRSCKQLPGEVSSMESLSPAAQKAIVEFVKTQGVGGTGNLNHWTATPGGGTTTITTGGITYTTIGTTTDGDAFVVTEPPAEPEPLSDLTMDIYRRQRMAFVDTLDDDE